MPSAYPQGDRARHGDFLVFAGRNSAFRKRCRQPCRGSRRAIMPNPTRGPHGRPRSHCRAWLAAPLPDAVRLGHATVPERSAPLHDLPQLLGVHRLEHLGQAARHADPAARLPTRAEIARLAASVREDRPHPVRDDILFAFDSVWEFFKPWPEPAVRPTATWSDGGRGLRLADEPTAFRRERGGNQRGVADVLAVGGEGSALPGRALGAGDAVRRWRLGWPPPC